MFYAHFNSKCALGNVFHIGGSMDMGGGSQVNVRANLSEYFWSLLQKRVRFETYLPVGTFRVDRYAWRENYIMKNHINVTFFP